MMKPYVNILWITDIHFSNDYRDMITNEKNADLTTYIENFITRIRYKHNDEPVNYIFLTGDLARTGSKKDYDAFRDLFLTRVLDVFIESNQSNGRPLPLLIMIPGNHDVNWDNSNFCSNYVLAKNKRGQFLKDNPDEFETLFFDYTNFICELAKVRRYKEFFRYLKSPLVSDSYKKHFLYGHIFDEANNLLIILLNTAWFSLGVHFNDIFAQELFKNKVYAKPDDRYVAINSEYFKISERYIKKPNAVDSKNDDDYLKIGQQYLKIDSEYSQIDKEYRVIKGKHYEPIAADDTRIEQPDLIEILKEKDGLIEYANQVCGIDLIEKDTIDNYLKNYSEAITISCMHHPFNWLQWDEYYSYASSEGSVNKNAKILSDILEQSNLLLTGHEHMPFDFDAELIQENTIHIKGGCFLFDQPNEHKNLYNTWFSFISIDTERQLMTQTKEGYMSNQGWNSKKKTRSIAKANRPVSLTIERFAKIQEILKSNDLRITKSLLKRKFGDNNMLSLKRDVNNFSSIRLYEAKFSSPKNELVIVATGPEFYTNLSTPNFIRYLHDLIAKLQSPNVTVRFLIFDIFVSGAFQLYEKSSTIAERNMKLERIVKISDWKFNFWRFEYLKTALDKSAPQQTPYASDDFRRLNGVVFVNHIVPYWVIN